MMTRSADPTGGTVSHPATPTAIRLSRDGRQIHDATPGSRRDRARSADAADGIRYRPVKRLGVARTTPEAMRENPNEGKRHVARMTDALLVELARAKSQAYRPLKVATPLRTPTGRHSRRGGSPEYSAYTV
jgi:hypothetical protein